MSATMSGGTVPTNFSNAGGALQAFNAVFNGLSTTTISGSGVSTLTGGDVLGVSNIAVTVAGSGVADFSSGNNAITTINPATVFAAPGDTISSAAATTVFGASTGTTAFSLSGAGSSVTGGAGAITGLASGANSTLIGGTGGGTFTIGGGGAGSLAVAGQAPGVTNVTLAETTGGAQIATSPLGNSGTLIATLSSAGADTVVGGGGASTISGGGGADVFGFVNGHAGGTETILNFTAKDTFAFGGYGAAPISAETFTVTNAGSGIGNDVITLTDGTVINVVDVNGKIF